MAYFSRDENITHDSHELALSSDQETRQLLQLLLRLMLLQDIPPTFIETPPGPLQ